MRSGSLIPIKIRKIIFLYHLLLKWPRLGKIYNSGKNCLILAINLYQVILSPDHSDKVLTQIKKSKISSQLFRIYQTTNH